MNIENIKIIQQPESEEMNKLEIKKFLEQKVEGKIKIIQELWSLALENKNLPLEEFGNSMMEFKKDFMDYFNDDLKEEYEKLKKHEKEKEEIEIKMYYNEECNDEEVNDMVEKLDILNEKIYKLSSEDLLFLKNVNDFINNIVLKRYEVDELEKAYKKGGADEFFQKLGRNPTADLSSEERKRIEINFSGHCVNLILPKDVYKKISNDVSTGCHYTGTVINLISDTPNKDRTIRHEENHNLSESFVEQVIYSDSFLEEINSRINRIEKLRNLGATEAMIKNEMSNIKGVISNYVFKNFSELVADINEPSRENIRNYFSQFLRTVNDLDVFIGEVKDEELKKELSLGVNKLEKEFIKHIEKLANIYFVSNNTGNNEDMKGAILLFGHDKINKVERYLKSKIGKDKYNTIESIRPISGERNAYFSGIRSSRTSAEKTLDNIFGVEAERSEKIISILNKDKEDFFKGGNLEKLISDLNALKNTDQEAFKQVVSLISKEEILNNEGAKLFVRKMRNIEELVEMDRLLKKLGKTIDVPELSNQVEEIYLSEYVDELYNISLADDDFEELVELFKGDYFNMRSSKKYIEEILSVDIEFLIDDLPDYCDNDIKRTKFWDFIKTIGLENEASKAHDSIKKNR